MFTDTQTQLEIIPVLMKNTLDLVLGFFDDDKEGSRLGEIESNPDKYGFQLIYSERGKQVFTSSGDFDFVEVKEGVHSLNGLQINSPENSN
jgi:hypothetical protein